MDSVTQKQCNKCFEWKSLHDFYKQKDRRLGVSAQCKVCERERLNLYKKLHPEKILEQGRKYKSKNWEKILEWARGWKHSNVEKTRQTNRNWYLSHKETAMKNARLRRAREKGAEGKITAREWKSVLEKYGNKCLCCGRNNINLTMDHVVPLKFGGTHTVENVQPLCISCNSKKGTKHIDYR